MLFTQVEFLVFFAVVFSATWLTKSNRWRKVVLLAASAYFYAYWDWRFLGLLGFTCITSYAFASLVESSPTQRTRKFALAACIILNLAVLAYFKYANFFLDSFTPLFIALGFSVRSLEIILPVGISFYTFQCLSYAIDVYRRELDASHSPPEFLPLCRLLPPTRRRPHRLGQDLSPSIANPASPRSGSPLSRPQIFYHRAISEDLYR